MTEGGVWTVYGPCPKPSNHAESLANKRREVWAFLGHLRGYFNGRIKVSNAFLCLVAHPLAVISDILGQPLCTVPLAKQLFLLWAAVPIRIDRRSSCELRRNLNHCLVDQDSHRI